jgi:deoxyribodipyrimidine photolyase-related protein
MYLDSAEWATLPNVMGLLMATDSENGEGCDSFGSKPYAASAHYIGTMSDYCKGCFYNGKKRLGEKACPFNYLYWNFVGEFQNRFQHNPRMKNAVQMYRLKPKNERELIESSSKKFLDKVIKDGTDSKVRVSRI